MSQDKPREFWIKITQFENVGMGGFRYSDAEISIDPNCGYNYEDFKNAIHVVEMSALAEAQAELEKYKEENATLKVVLRKQNGELKMHIKMFELIEYWGLAGNILHYRDLTEKLEQIEAEYEPNGGV